MFKKNIIHSLFFFVFFVGQISEAVVSRNGKIMAQKLGISDQDGEILINQGVSIVGAIANPEYYKQELERIHKESSEGSRSQSTKSMSTLSGSSTPGPVQMLDADVAAERARLQDEHKRELAVAEGRIKELQAASAHPAPGSAIEPRFIDEANRMIQAGYRRRNLRISENEAILQVVSEYLQKNAGKKKSVKGDALIDAVDSEIGEHDHIYADTDPLEAERSRSPSPAPRVRQDFAGMMENGDDPDISWRRENSETYADNRLAYYFKNLDAPNGDFQKLLYPYKKVLYKKAFMIFVNDTGGRGIHFGDSPTEVADDLVAKCNLEKPVFKGFLESYKKFLGATVPLEKARTLNLCFHKVTQLEQDESTYELIFTLSKALKDLLTSHVLPIRNIQNFKDELIVDLYKTYDEFIANDSYAQKWFAPILTNELGSQKSTDFGVMLREMGFIVQKKTLLEFIQQIDTKIRNYQSKGYSVFALELIKILTSDDATASNRVIERLNNWGGVEGKLTQNAVHQAIARLRGYIGDSVIKQDYRMLELAIYFKVNYLQDLGKLRLKRVLDNLAESCKDNTPKQMADLKKLDLWMAAAEKTLAEAREQKEKEEAKSRLATTTQKLKEAINMVQIGNKLLSELTEVTRESPLPAPPEAVPAEPEQENVPVREKPIKEQIDEKVAELAGADKKLQNLLNTLFRLIPDSQVYLALLKGLSGKTSVEISAAVTHEIEHRKVVKRLPGMSPEEGGVIPKGRVAIGGVPSAVLSNTFIEEQQLFHQVAIGLEPRQSSDLRIQIGKKNFPPERKIALLQELILLKSYPEKKKAVEAFQ
ncbi:MAG: hypothetical protein WCG05_00220 [Alphaproteobacteria bacterium]